MTIISIGYPVNGKKVQINVINTPDLWNAEKLMTKLKSMKSEEALLQKELTVYEFVGQNDVLSLIAEGRKHLDHVSLPNIKLGQLTSALRGFKEMN
jgi:hypothetical protein